MKRSISIGHTGITWPINSTDEAIETVGRLGYHGIELFGSVIEQRESDGNGIGPVLEKAGIPYVSSYCSAPLVDARKRTEGVQNCLNWARLTKQYGGSVIVLGGDPIDRRSFTYADRRSDIVDTINAIGRAVSEIGVTCCFHPHTGTPVQTESEIRSTMDSIDPQAVKFAPDVGQIAKGGSDPNRILSDYISLVKHVHLKDFVGGTVIVAEDGSEVDRTGYLDYEIVGRGVIDLEAMMDMLEESGFDGYAMVELDGTHFSGSWKGPAPMQPGEAAAEAKRYLQSIGYQFRT